MTNKTFVGQLGPVAGQLAATLAGLKQQVQPGAGPLHTLLSDTAISGQMRRSVSHVAQVMQKRNQRIEALQHSFLLRGCFRRQEKTKAQTGK